MERLRVWGAAAMLALAAAAARAEVRVGVVDIVDVMNNYDRTKDASADLQVEQAGLKAASDPKIRKIEDVRNQRDGFNKGTAEWKRLDEQALEAEIGLRTELTLRQAQIERRHQDILMEMYVDIQQAVATVARQRGVDVVFTKAFLSPPQIDLADARGLEDLKGRIVAQRLIFPADPADVTQDVLKKLNDDFRKRKAAGSAPGTGAAPGTGTAPGTGPGAVKPKG